MVNHNQFDSAECLCWYIGRLRRDTLAREGVAIAEVVMQRMNATVDDLIKAIDGKPAKQIEFLLGRHFRKITSGLTPEARGVRVQG